jgi:hypothetical protein
MSFFRPKRRDTTDLDTYERLVKSVSELRAAVSRIETEWADTKAQVQRSYQRMERANQRAEARLQGPPDEPRQEAARPESAIEKQLRLARASRGG